MPKAEFVAMVIRALWHPIAVPMLTCCECNHVMTSYHCFVHFCTVLLAGLYKVKSCVVGVEKF
jgi:hypothetical protein